MLDLFWDAPEDDRPRHAVRQAEAWARGEVATGTVMRSAVAAHAAARTSAGAAQAAARAAGHAAATAHMADHSLAAASYALQAAVDGERERRWQDRMLPPAVRPLVLDVRADLAAQAGGAATRRVAAAARTGRPADGASRGSSTSPQRAYREGGASTLTPEDVRRRLEAALRTGVPAWNPYE